MVRIALRLNHAATATGRHFKFVRLVVSEMLAAMGEKC
jgi:hypothetical protein